MFVRPGTEAFNRCDDHARIELLNVFPSDAHAVERARRKVLNQHVATFNQGVEHLFALGFFGVKRNRALVVIKHREIQAIDTGNIA